MVNPIPTGAFHVSRQALAQSLDFQEVARNDAQIDRALAQGTANVEAYLRRGFFPWRGTLRFNWPDPETSRTSSRIWLNDHDLIELTAIAAGDATIAPANIVPYPSWGPPYTYVETSYATNSVFQSGDTWQNAIALTGLWGYSVATQNITTTTGAINDTATTLPLTDASDVGVGNVVKIDDEYLVITELAYASTSQTLATPLTASAANTAVITSGGTFHPGEVITLDSEQMKVLAVTGATLTVKRAWAGTVLATHSGSTIYAARSVNVSRGACGSTAASHLSGATVALHLVPGPVQALTTAEAAWLYAGHASGWQTAPGTTNRSTATEAALSMINDLRKNARAAVGRKARQRAV